MVGKERKERRERGGQENRTRGLTDRINRSEYLNEYRIAVLVKDVTVR